MGSVRRIQDSVHGLMEFRGMESIVVEVLRTPELQRLRKVKQLGLAHYVFPGAEHSRFSHSLGAAHLAIRFGRQVEHDARRVFVPELVPDDHAIADLALGALCHDLGHGPLSHAWEREIVGEKFDRKAWASQFGLRADDPVVRTGKWHELVGQGLLAWPDGQLHRLLELQEQGRADRVRQLLSGSYYYPYLPRLLSSDVDVDRADYIMRDTHNTGVAYGRFDLDWLISTCMLGRSVATGKWVVGFDSHKAVRVIEQFLIARRAMYDTVYHHKTVRCIEGMVERLLRRLKDITALGAKPALPEFAMPAIKTIRGDALHPEEFLQLDDFAIFVLIDAVARGAFKDDTASDLARRILARDLFKLVPVSAEAVAAFMTSVENIQALYATVQRYVPGKGNYYVVVDLASFEMLAGDSAHGVMLVDGERLARRGADHETLMTHRGGERSQARLFTIPAAIDAVRRLVAEA